MNIDATANFEASQTLPSLTICDRAVATLGTLPPMAPAPFADPGFDTWEAGAGLAANAGQAVPEPGSLGLLLAGALGVLARRRRPQHRA